VASFFGWKIRKAKRILLPSLYWPPLLIIKSLDASGGGVFRIMIGPAMLD
jgi:hypothetical protein